MVMCKSILILCLVLLAGHNISSYSVQKHHILLRSTRHTSPKQLKINTNYNHANSRSHSIFATESSSNGVALNQNQDTSPSLSFMGIPNFLNVVWKFSRPHTIVGSIISIVSLFLYATDVSAWTSPKFLRGLLAAVVPSLFMNVYITGLNQITDVEIDKINKPYLPIASGELSKQNGVNVVIFSLILSCWLIRNAAWPLQVAVLGSCFLGSCYSLPPVRLKQFPLLAAVCILVVRGTLINMGFYLQAKLQMNPIMHSMNIKDAILAYPQSIAVTAFFAIFGLVIALMKDTPDVEGDLSNGIRSFSVQMGAARMFRISWKLLFGLTSATSAYFLYTASIAETILIRVPRILVGVVLGLFSVDLRKKAIEVLSPYTDGILKTSGADFNKSIFAYYMYVWKIFYGCYLLLPFAK